MGDIEALMQRGALLDWLDVHRPELGAGPLEYQPLKGGSSMSILKLTRGAGAAVLRMPSIPPRADSTKAITREARLLTALNGSIVPHAERYGFCEDESILGAPFILMAFVDGWLNWGEGRTPPPPWDKPGPHHRDLAFAMIDAIATLRTVDYQAAGLTDFGKPEGFLTRQVPRYLKQIESYKVTENHPGREIPGMDYVASWLQANTPEMSAATLIHGDTGFPNLLFARDLPARVAALIDWEVATIGDPLLDLARAIFNFPGRRISNPKLTEAELADVPTREDLTEHYAKLTGADVSNIDYYIVLSIFRLCALIEWNYARHVHGRDHSGLAKYISDLVLDMMLFAEQLARAA